MEPLSRRAVEPHVSEEQAWDFLRRYSRKHHVKIRDLASRVREQGSLA
ncbi:ANTAR domain-containing protein [Streptomyces sp. NBC_00838]